jgi:hypothetical protein
MEGIDSYNWLKSERENRLKSTKIRGFRAKVRGPIGPLFGVDGLNCANMVKNGEK